MSLSILNIALWFNHFLREDKLLFFFRKGVFFERQRVFISKAKSNAETSLSPKHFCYALGQHCYSATNLSGNFTFQSYYILQPFGLSADTSLHD